MTQRADPAHDNLRHREDSLLIRHGESVRVVHDITRAAVDRAFGNPVAHISHGSALSSHGPKAEAW